MNIDTLSVLTWIVLIISAISGFVLGLSPLIKDTAERKWKSQFRKQIRLGIINNHLKYNDMLHLAERWFQDRKSIMFSLRIMHSDSVSGEDEDLAKNIDAIRDLMQQHQKQEPYSELPENISIQLSSLNSTPENQETISQLAASLSELYVANQQKFNKQVLFTYWGIIIGIIGLLIGLVGLYFAVSGGVVR
ncbi:MAG: hypothetical protein ACI9LM_004537 [Alteromonadaceae bacterium]|jgi:hypothetical protein